MAKIDHMIISSLRVLKASQLKRLHTSSVNNLVEDITGTISKAFTTFAE